MDAVSSRVLLGASGAGDQPWGPVSIGSSMEAVCWTGTQFFAGGGSGSVQISTDGISWRAGNIGWGSSTVSGVAGNNSILVASRSLGRISTAPANNIGTWTARTSGVGVSLTAGVWTGSQFVFVGGSGAVITSPDGITWTVQTSGVGAFLRAVTWTGTQLVAVGDSGTIITSPDGVTWTAQSSGTTSALYSVGSSDSLILVGLDNNVLRSADDGVTWALSSVSFSGYPGSILWTGERYVAVQNFASVVSTSLDGVSWTSGLIFPLDDTVNYNEAAWSGTRMVVVGNTGQIATSETGLPDSWTSRTTIKSANQLNAVAYYQNTYIAVGNRGRGFTSADGITWSAPFYVDAALQARRGLAHSASVIVAVGDDSTIQTSTNGTTWTSRVTSTASTRLDAVAWSGSTFVAVGSTSTATGLIRSSADGITWTTRTSNATKSLSTVAWGNGLFVAAGTDGVLVTSPTGTTWTARTSGISFPEQIKGLAYGSGRYTGVSSGGKIITSTNGTTWSVQQTVANASFDTVLWTGSQFLAFYRDDNGFSNGLLYVYASRDGVTWSLAPFSGVAGSIGSTIKSAAVAGPKVVAVGALYPNEASGAIVYMSPRPPTPPYPTV